MSEPIRLSVNVAPDVAEALRKWTAAHGISTTEGVRRAVAVWNFVETERAKGNTLAVIEPGPVVREVVMVEGVAG